MTRQSYSKKIQDELDGLITDGDTLLLILQREIPNYFTKEQLKQLDDHKLTRSNFPEKYELWYSAALSVVRQLITHRAQDFIELYRLPKRGKNIDHSNYTISDYMNNLSVTRGPFGEEIAGPKSAIPKLQQQLGIIVSARNSLTSSLFNIRQIVQADVFENELEAARALLKHGFNRAAGAIAGVVLERHLKSVCDLRNISISKRNQTIGGYNEELHKTETIGFADFRFIQSLAAIRNQCDHVHEAEPKPNDVSELIDGVGKITKKLN